MEMMFEEKEVKEVVQECGSDKSSILDYFNFKFIKDFWQVFKADIMRFMREFNFNGVISRGYNPSFITLIAKVENPQSLGEFRPISLVG